MVGVRDGQGTNLRLYLFWFSWGSRVGCVEGKAGSEADVWNDHGSCKRIQRIRLQASSKLRLRIHTHFEDMEGLLPDVMDAFSVT